MYTQAETLFLFICIYNNATGISPATGLGNYTVRWMKNKDFRNPKI